MSAQNNIGLSASINATGFPGFVADVKRATDALLAFQAAAQSTGLGGIPVASPLGPASGGPLAGLLQAQMLKRKEQVRIARELAAQGDFSGFEQIERENIASAATEKAKRLTDRAMRRRISGENEANRLLIAEETADLREADRRAARVAKQERAVGRAADDIAARDVSVRGQFFRTTLEDARGASSARRADMAGIDAFLAEDKENRLRQRRDDRAAFTAERIADLRARVAGPMPVMPTGPNVGVDERAAFVEQERLYRNNLQQLRRTLSGGSLVERQEALGITDQLSTLAARRAADNLRLGEQRDAETEARNLRLSQGIIARQALLNARPLQSALEGITSSSRLQSLEAGFAAFGGTSGDIRGLRAATGGRVSDESLIGGALRLGVQMPATETSPGLDPAKRDRLLGNAARLGSVFMGSAQSGIDAAVEGVAKLSTNILDNIGVTVRLDEVTRAYAKTQGKSVQAVTEREKVEALFQETLKQTDSLVQKIGKEVGTSQASVERMTTTLVRWRNQLDIGASGAGTALQTGLRAGGEAALSAGSFQFANAQGNWKQRLGVGIAGAALAGTTVTVGGTLLTWLAAVAVPLIGDLIASIGENTAATNTNTRSAAVSAPRAGSQDSNAMMNLLLGGR